MADKNSIINAAQKYASKGNIDAAITEYEKLVTSGNDGNIQNTIGDLYLRKGSEAQAVEAFTKAADIFRKSGFYPKAIAIYKKVLNIQPNSVESLIALAKLNASKGLNASAADYYFKAADIFQRNGYAEKATQAVERILKLTTNDIGIRIKIADWYIKSGIKPRAANEYAAIAISYLEKDDTANAEQFFTKATEMDPDSIASFVGLSRLAETTGNIELAFKHLEEAISRDPDSKDTLIAYAEFSIRNNKLDDAIKTLLKLIEKSPSFNHARKLLGGLYLDENNPERAWEQLLPCIDAAINDKKWADAIELLDKFRELHPVPVRERIIEVYRSAEDSENLAKGIMELANLYKGQGSNDDALRLYKELLESDPDNTEAADRIKELESSPESGDMQVKTPPDTTGEPVIETFVPPDVAAKKDPPLTEALLEKKVEADFYAKQGMNEEAKNIYKDILTAVPDHQGIKKKLEDLQSVAAPSEEVVIKKMFDDEEETRDKLDAGSAAEELKDIFDEFAKDEVYEKEEDYEARYNAGLESKKQGQLDEAIKEFRIAAEDPGKTLVSRSIIALCYMEKGAFADAVTEFNEVYESMSSTDASYLRIKYELAGAYRKDGNNKKALELYSEIKEKDPEFKDVSKKIEELSPVAPKPAPEKPAPEKTAAPMPAAEKPAADESKPKKKKNRVSYI